MKLTCRSLLKQSFSKCPMQMYNVESLGRLSDYNGTRIHNQLACKQTLNCLAKLAKLHGPFHCMLLSCHVHVFEEIHPQLPQSQGTSCLKQVQYLKFK